VYGDATESDIENNVAANEGMRASSTEYIRKKLTENKSNDRETD
jgi:hypothetical protein